MAVDTRVDQKTYQCSVVFAYHGHQRTSVQETWANYGVFQVPEVIASYY